MHLKISEGMSDTTRRIHFNFVDEGSSQSEDKDFLIELPFFASNEKILEHARFAPKTFCVHFKTILSTPSTIVIELEHSKVPLLTAMKMMRPYFENYFENLKG